MPPTPRLSRWFWILVPLGLGTLLALAVLLVGDARRAEAADLGGVTDAVSGGASVLPAPLEPVADVVAPAPEVVDPATLEPVADVVAPVAEVVDPAVDVVAPVVDPAVDVVAPVVDPVLEVVAPVVTPVVDVVAPVLEVVAPVVTPIVDVVAPVVTPITDVVDPTTPAGPVIPPVLAPAVGTVDPVATPAIEPLTPVAVRVVPPSGAASVLPIGAASGAQPPDLIAGITPAARDTASITLDSAPSPSGIPTLPPNSNEPFAPLSSSTSASGGVPYQLLLFAVLAMLAGLLGSRARRLLLLGAITPRFTAVYLSARPG
jgi:hypothetical protein